MSTSSTYISLKFDISNNLTKPSATYSFPVITTYFNSFLPKLGGINYSFVSTKPTINLKRSKASRDINLYYSSNFTIVKRIHDFYDVKQNDLEMIIEHTPDPKNTDQNNLYMCFGFKSDIPNNSVKSDGFVTLFDYISTDNIKTSTLNQANQDNYKITYENIQFNSALGKLNSKDTVLNPDAVHYLDNSGNTFIVYRRAISISSKNYDALVNALRNVETSAIFSSTNCQPAQDGVIVPIPFEAIQVPFTTLTEGFVSLRKSIEGMVNTTDQNKNTKKYMYCKPSDNIGGDDKLVTTTINAYANATNKNDGTLLNEVTMIFIIMIVFLFMAFFSPIWFIESNKYLKYNITFLWICRIAAIVLILGGGLLTIVVSRTSNDVPEWLLLVGVIMIICFVLFYMIIYAFQKQNLHIQLTDLIENTFEDVDKNNIKYFRNYIFGETI